jgi:protein-S-isoprenylcysteine O-methyltransferase Ste14
VAVTFGRPRLYVGRLIMVLSFAGILIADFFGLDHGIHPGTAGVLRSVGAAHAAAITATWLSLVLPLLHGAPPGQRRQALADVLLTRGMVWAVWSLAVWVAMCALQIYRAVREEQVLLQAWPAYRSYRNRTAALLPGLF